jgi:ATP-dependent Lhr-like helicase
MSRQPRSLEHFHAVVSGWFASTFTRPTPVQEKAWPTLKARESALLLAPTGSGKTLAAFLAALDGLFFEPLPEQRERLRVLYVSPLKALGVDIEKNLASPIRGIYRNQPRRR